MDMADNNPGSGKRWLLPGVAALIGVAAAVGFLAGQRAGKPAPADRADAIVQQPAPPGDAAGFLQAVAGEWQADGERLLIKHDKSVVEILRESKAGAGQVRLDQYVVAPQRLDAAQQHLFVETPEGIWRLALLPGARRAQLSITYPDQRNVLYQ
jgi:hypothetical protein